MSSEKTIPWPAVPIPKPEEVYAGLSDQAKDYPLFLESICRQSHNFEKPEALSRLRVYDTSTRMMIGHWCSSMLSELGAEVIQIEPPGGGFLTWGAARPGRRHAGVDCRRSAHVFPSKDRRGRRHGRGATPHAPTSCGRPTFPGPREIGNPAEVSRPPLDPALASHLERLRGYMRGTGLEVVPPDDRELRRTLADALERHTPAVLDRWLGDIGPSLGIPADDWDEIRRDMTAAIQRWARHVADPDDVETYEVLHRHASRGFIARFPASRFLAGQMQLTQLLAEEIQREHADRPEHGLRLVRLLAQEFQERVLHITDFFVQARERELLEQEASYRRAIDRAPACILMVDAIEGTVFDANHIAERLLGFTREELVGRRFTKLHLASDRARAEALWHTALERGHASREDLHILPRRGDPIPMFTNAGVIEYGARRYVQMICVDISDRKRLEGQLVQSEKMAAIGQLAAGIAHELRNPLAIVMNALWDLRHVLDGSADSEVGEDLRIAEEEIGRAQSIIKNLLEFSRESGAELERLDVNDLVTRTLQLMQKYLQDNGVRVTTELGAISPCQANLNAMRQILLNLITNAVQAMPKGGDLVLRTADAGQNTLRLEVSDTGVGIPPEHLTDIFNPFYTTKAPGQGTGLGLSVVHSILQRYRGEIRVASQVDHGTTFTILLPCPCHADVALPT